MKTKKKLVESVKSSYSFSANPRNHSRHTFLGLRQAQNQALALLLLQKDFRFCQSRGPYY